MKYMIYILLFSYMLAEQAFSGNNEFAGGDGSEDNPWQIAEPHHLDNMRNYLDDYFELISDIDLSGTEFVEGEGWEPIGKCDYSIAGCTEEAFTGFLDGNTHTIHGLYINNNDDEVGLFGAMVDGAVVVDLNLTGVDITAGAPLNLFAGALTGVARESEIFAVTAEGQIEAYSSTGGLIGQMTGGFGQDLHAAMDVIGEDGTGGLIGNMNDGGFEDPVILNRSSATGDVTGRLSVGGLVGALFIHSEVRRSYATGDVSGDAQAGGLIGASMNAEISKSFATGNTHSDTFGAGGLIGWNNGDLLYDSYATGNVTGATDVGGLIGSQTRGSVQNCYSTGQPQLVAGDDVEEEGDVGGLVGRHSGGSVTESFWDTQTSGMEDSPSGTGLTTELMQMKSTFTDAGWNFDDEPVWTIIQDEGSLSYPYLVENQQDPPPGHGDGVYSDPVPSIPEMVTLNQNYPNPFNPSTVISFELPESMPVMLTVYNMLGQRLKTLIHGQLQSGHHDVKFDATGFSSGLYIYRLEAGNEVHTRKMLYMK